MVYAGLAVVLAITGPGRCSLDHAFGLDRAAATRLDASRPSSSASSPRFRRSCGAATSCVVRARRSDQTLVPPTHNEVNRHESRRDRRPSTAAGRSSSATRPCSPWTPPGVHRGRRRADHRRHASPRSARSSSVPDGTVEIDASGGILMPGMVDTHRHMWQTALRGLGADWTLSAVLRLLLPDLGQDLPARRTSTPATCCRAVEAVDAGVTTTRRLVARPADGRARRGRRSTRCAVARAASCSPTATCSAAPWEWTNSAGVPLASSTRRFGSRDDMLGLQLAFDVTGDPAFPERAAFEAARELGLPVTTHAGVWGATNDDEHPADVGGRLHDARRHLRARRDADRGLLPADRGDAVARRRCRPRASRARARATRPPGSCASTASRCRCRWTPACGGAPTCSRRCAPRCRPTGPASTSRRTRAATPSSHNQLRAEEVVALGDDRRRARARPATRASARVTPGKKADLVLIKNDESPAMFPLLHPYGSVVFQAGRGDVHTVAGQRPGASSTTTGWSASTSPRRATPSAATVEYARATMGEEAWRREPDPGAPAGRADPEPVHLHRLRGRGVAAPRAERRRPVLIELGTLSGQRFPRT